MGSNSDERADSMDRIISYRCFVYERWIAVGNWLMFVGEVNKDDRMDLFFVMVASISKWFIEGIEGK